MASSETTPLLQSGASTRGKRKRSVTISCEVQQEIVDYNPDDIKLRKHITLPVTVGIIIGNVIGSGIFISPVNVLGSVGSVGGALLIWLTVGLYCLLQALCYAELGTVIPKAGGDYAYIYYILGPLPAFMCVWMHVAMICTSSNAAIARTAATYLLKPLSADCNAVLVTCMAMWIIVTFAIINIISTKWGTRVQSIFSTAKVGALVLIILLGIIYLGRGNTENFNEPFKGTTTEPGLFALAILDGYFAFKGWELVNTLPEEMVNPKKDLPRGIVIAMLSITSIYVLTNVAFFAVLSLDELFASDAVALTFAQRMLPRVPWIMSIFVAMSCMGTINGSFLSDTRYLFAGGRFEQVPRMFAMLSFKFYTPVLPIVVVCIISMCYTLIPTVSELVEYASLGVQLKIMLSLVALLHLRRTRPDLKRPVKVNILVIILTLVFLLALVGFNLYQNPRVAGVGIGLFVLGIPLYFLGNFLKRFQASHDLDEAVTILSQNLLYIVPESRRKRKYTMRIDEMFPPPPSLQKDSDKKTLSLRKSLFSSKDKDVS